MENKENENVSDEETIAMKFFAYHPLKNRSLRNDAFESFFIKVSSRKVLVFGTKLTRKT